MTIDIEGIRAATAFDNPPLESPTWNNVFAAFQL